MATFTLVRRKLVLQLAVLACSATCYSHSLQGLSTRPVTDSRVAGNSLTTRGLLARPSALRSPAHPTMSSTPPDEDDADEENNSLPRMTPAPRLVPDVPPQLARSRALANEGLDGFPNKVKDLLILGGTFWLGIPALVALLVSVGGSAALYGNLGDRFIHGGTPAGRRGNLEIEFGLPPMDTRSGVPPGGVEDEGRSTEDGQSSTDTDREEVRHPHADTDK
ncbi:hypothetical protein T492DRAFT_1022092 [Pavlovales sp. CCMP2436]|nr:hypothetical protein T492DRAFT_1022092 [Pavlovales sp. CCMP2436]|mmetsp:Transcript_389/g.1101  ORF Transcript_389/g.1101 Transcript_389/m.1101 type:complete len:221 (+) Transcript_389:3-665(+)